MIKTRINSASISVFLAAIVVATPSVASARSKVCKLGGKQIIYQIDECTGGPCNTGGEMLKVVGDKVLQYRSTGGGVVYHLGKTIRLEDDPAQINSPEQNAPNSAHNTMLTASLSDNLLSLREDQAIRRPDDADGHIVSIQRVKIRPDCTFCDVLEYTMTGTLADGTVLGKHILSGSKCYVSDIPPD